MPRCVLSLASRGISTSRHSSVRRSGVCEARRRLGGSAQDGRCVKRDELRAENGQDPTALRVPRSWGRYGRSRTQDGRCVKRDELRAENGQDPTALRVPRSWGRYGRSRMAGRAQRVGSRAARPDGRSRAARPGRASREVGVVMAGRAQRVMAGRAQRVTEQAARTLRIEPVGGRAHRKATQGHTLARAQPRTPRSARSPTLTRQSGGA